MFSYLYTFAFVILLIAMFIGLDFKQEPEQTPLKIVLLGQTGSGKSTFGNFLLGYSCFKTGASSEAVTTLAFSGNGTLYGNKTNSKIIVVDTQGHNDLGGRDLSHNEQMTSVLLDLS